MSSKCSIHKKEDLQEHVRDHAHTSKRYALISHAVFFALPALVRPMTVGMPLGPAPEHSPRWSVAKMGPEVGGKVGPAGRNWQTKLGSGRTQVPHVGAGDTDFVKTRTSFARQILVRYSFDPVLGVFGLCLGRPPRATSQIRPQTRPGLGPPLPLRMPHPDPVALWQSYGAQVLLLPHERGHRLLA